MGSRNQHVTLDSLLPQVEKPGRYIGGEWNAVTKHAATTRLRICLAFPDLYELGLGNLGLQILYAILNDLDGVWAERAYLPAQDMARRMTEVQTPLFMLESKAPVAVAHAVGFTLQSELTYVNILKMLELSGIALLSHERDETMPLIFAGGPGAYNPAPLAPFMDFFVVGDGEEAIVEIAECLMRHAGATRNRKCEALAAIEGVYVPAVHGDHRVRARAVASLDEAPFPARMITPYTQLVHDGAGIEVLRGCTHGCRFCMAGMITRPVRERSVDTILDLLDSAMEGTGLEDATLVSLSTCDYSRARTLLRRVSAQAHARHMAVALPSLRLDRFAIELADYISPMRRSGLTFAPEAGTARLRSVINKHVADEQLIALAEEAFQRGWRHIKTYFMIGLPTETDADVDAIADLCVRTLEAGKRIHPRAMVRTGVSTFVPKPFTPFQWAAQIGMEETRDKQHRLAELLRPFRGIKFGRHAPEASFIEGLLSRADHNAAPLLLSVLRHGGGYETWDEHLNMAAWTAAIEETGYDAEAQLGARSMDAPLPWAHIDAQITHEALRQEWDRALQEEFTADCREDNCRQCGASRRTGEACRLMRERAAEGKIEEAAVPLEPSRPPEMRAGVQRIRFRVGREGLPRFLSHLETAQVWIRALRRAGAPLAYSQGFHAHPKVTFATALPVGEESEAELMDIVLYEHRAPEALLEVLCTSVPEGFHVYEAWEAGLKTTSLMAAQCGLKYVLFTSEDQVIIAARIAALEQTAQWLVNRKVKRGSERVTIPLDIRPLVSRLEASQDAAGGTCVYFSTSMRDGKLAKAREIIELLVLDPLHTRIRKTATVLEQVER